MHQITLTSYFTYAPSKVPQSVVLDDVALPAGIKAPETGLTTLYGFGDALSEMSRVRQSATAKGKAVATVLVNLSMDQVYPGRVPLGLLEGSSSATDRSGASKPLVDKAGNPYERPRMIMLDRLQEATVRAVRQRLEAAAEKRGLAWENPFVNAGFVCPRPELLDDLMADPLFASVDLLVYRVPEAKGRNRQVATLFSGRSVSSIQARGLPDMTVRLPERVASPHSMSA